jgi:hypothetical protein
MKLFDDLEAVFGKGSVTSGYRSQAEQDKLVAAGKTRATRSSHTDGNGFDISSTVAKDKAEVAARLADAGISAKRVIFETGKGRNQGTGAHYHIEVDTGVKKVAVPASQAKANDPLDLNGMVNPVINPYEAAPKLAAAHQDVLQSTQTALDVFDSSAKGLQAVQDQRENNLRETNAKLDTVRTAVETDTTNLMNQVKPLFAQRAAIEERKAEIAKMPFIKKTLAGIFNRNYSIEHLSELEGAAEEQIQSIGQQFNMTTQMASTIESIASAKFQSADQYDQLIGQGHTLDLSVARDHLQLQSQRFTAIAEGFEKNDAVLRSQANAAGAALDLIKPGDLNSAIAKAKQNPAGVVTLNGANLNVQQLEHRALQIESQNLAIRSQRAAAAMQDLNRKQAEEDNLINNMSSSELKAAAANGGIFQGIQLDVAKLNNQFVAAVTMEANVAGVAVQSAEAQGMGGQVRALKNETKLTTQRLSQLSGPDSNKPYAQMIQQNAARLMVIADLINKAPDNAKETLRARFAGEIAKMRQQQMGAVDGIIQGYSRDPNAQATVRAWVLGQEQTPESQIKGIIALTAGGQMPPGVMANSEAGKALTAASKAQADFMASERGKKLKGPQLQRELMTVVGEAVGNTWVNAVNNRVWNQLPQMALADGHAAGKIQSRDFLRAQQVGDESGFQIFASDHGISVTDAKLMFKNGPGSKQFKDIQAKNQNYSYKQAENDLDGLQRRMFINTLDSSPSATPGFRPSDALADYLSTPGIHGRVAALSKNAGQMGFGESVADGVSRGGLGQKMKEYADAFSRTVTSVDVESGRALEVNHKSYTKYGGVTRTQTILSGIKGLTPSDISFLVNGLRTAGAIDVTSGPEVVDGAIMSHKFQDPNLERIRKVAAKEWTDAAERTDRIVDAYHNNQVRSR